ncbi:MAG: response regulator transcription factor [Chloroflexi bacterium]|nr:response regulator transcription factor [Chloroflexota bacterium]
MAAHTVLVVEDEETLRRALVYNLEREGYRVLSSQDGADGLRQARESSPDVLILDLMLPTIDGLEVCRALRQTSSLPIIILTAKVDEVDRIVGLEVGADDYVTKPFSMRELMARVKALIRRSDLRNGHTGLADPSLVLRAGPLELQPSARVLTRRGEPIALRPKEFELLAFLMRNPGVVFSRDVLLERVWGYEYPGGTRTVDVHIRWLRIKIEDDPSQPRLLATVRGAGYKFEA